MRRLLRLVRQIRTLIDGSAEEPADLADMLFQYANVIRPWAATTASRMAGEVIKRERTAARGQAAAAEASGRIYKALTREMNETEVGEMFRRVQNEQVKLITGIPREAAERVQRLASEAAVKGSSRKALIKAIMETADITEGKAKLIARTETSRAFANLQMVRSQRAGITHYVWRTSNDSVVRHTHRLLNGTVHAWNDPPVCEEDGTRGHPGQSYNCRCTAIPVIPKD